ncbi:glucosamine-6-phosphate deaminase [Paenibacillus sp. HN-1]|uniref:glucosamine-6-phosphate deaminase n=1 Tax=Paenibacillus TaxID=44249 RepID=UPI001CA83E4A|nr:MULTISPECIES: glucosamine-6-phosphate deaminase [Paenibacillus]MBY9078643.1 glucosamine-6-phosphate deaminase [Paenibacillus sp. CGMCC 1.18879]MBY9084179.1 glucosamine-6-phosphate deaminase [Paenibacillus sinensis]
MNLYKISKNEDFAQTGANLVAGLLQTNPRAVLGLATGSSPISVYEELAAMHRRGLVSFSKASSFNLDEYVGLPADHPESYRSFMNRNLFDHIDIDLTRTHIPDGNAPDLAAECRAYDAMLEEQGPVDLQILGIGGNGHIGFNEPGTGLEGGTHVVDLLPETRQANSRFFPSIDEVPRQAITMGIGTILKARQILLLARGAEKAEAIRKAVRGPITTECPASLLQTHPNVVVLLDEGAGQWVN